MGLTPTARALHDYVEHRLAAFKTLEEDEDAQLPALPREWVKAMNAGYYLGQRTLIEGSHARLPSTWKVNDWCNANNAGPDYMVEVPILRWDNELVYDPEFD